MSLDTYNGSGNYLHWSVSDSHELTAHKAGGFYSIYPRTAIQSIISLMADGLWLGLSHAEIEKQNTFIKAKTRLLITDMIFVLCANGLGLRKVQRPVLSQFYWWLTLEPNDTYWKNCFEK